MNAAYTIRYEAPAAAAEALEARVRKLTGTTKVALMLAAAPLLGLAFVVAMPLAGLALIAWMVMKGMVRNRAAIAARVKRVALFLAAPFISLLYIAAFPFAALGMLVYCAVRATRS
jgi:hypothetical protein